MVYTWGNPVLKVFRIHYPRELYVVLRCGEDPGTHLYLVDYFFAGLLKKRVTRFFSNVEYTQKNIRKAFFWV